MSQQIPPGMVEGFTTVLLQGMSSYDLQRAIDSWLAKIRLRDKNAEKNTKYVYCIPGKNGVIYWATREGVRPYLLNWRQALGALQKTTVPAYKALQEQAENFFSFCNVARATDEYTISPQILPVLVRGAGVDPEQDLGAFFKVEWNKRRCVLPCRLISGKWEGCEEE